jgi:2-octaprenyl-6-methoxyphenol hydroxylase
MSAARIAIIGGGPVGLALALLLARRRVPSIVADARALDAARRDRRLLALSRGTLDALGALAVLPAAALAPIRSVVVSSRGDFGRAVLDERELGAGPLGATVRYGDVVGALDAACAGEAAIELRRPTSATVVAQRPDAVDVMFGGGERLRVAVAVNAEGVAPAGRDVEASQVALIGDIDVEGAGAGAAHERFTRDGPLALLPVPGPASGSARTMALVWCMPAAIANRRELLPDGEFLAELQSQLGRRDARVRAIRARGRYPLLEQARDRVREHRLVHVGNAAQSLHPVAGQGFNLGVRDCAVLAELLGAAAAAGEDPLARLADYERRRRHDRAAIRALTRTMPALFATRFAPAAAARSLGLTLLSIVPDLRVEFARLLMFGVRS